MAERPDLADVIPYLIVPAVVAVGLLIWAKRRGASWTQVQLSFGAAMLGAFMTASGWVVAGVLGGERPTMPGVLGSQLLVAAVCGVLAFFGTMPVEQDLTGELGDTDRQRASAQSRPDPQERAK